MSSRKITPVGNGKAAAVLNAEAIDALIAEGRERIVSAVTHGINRLREEYESRILELMSRAEGDLSEMSRRLEAAENNTELLGMRITALKEEIEKKQVGPATPERPGTSPTAPGTATSGRRSASGVKGSGLPAETSVTLELKPPGLGLTDWLGAHGIEFIDKRARADGSLWVVGPRARVKPVIDRLREQGIVFTYVAGGSKATASRPGWFTKHAH